MGIVNQPYQPEGYNIGLSYILPPDLDNVFRQDLNSFSLQPWQNKPSQWQPFNEQITNLTRDPGKSATQMKLKAGLAGISSSSPASQLSGQLLANEAVNDINGDTDSFINEVGVGKKRTFGDKFNDSTFGRNYTQWNTGLNMANTAFTGIFGEKSEYSGKRGDLTRGLDSAYDTISDAVSVVPGFGQAVGLGMKAGKLLGNVAGKLGGGTSGQTGADAILGSSFFSWNVGLVNGFGGQKADTITKDEDVFATVGSSYGGTGYKVDDALTKSGKKYGLFSNSSRKQANREIFEAKRQQNVMSDIADEATDRFNIRNSMAAINGNRYGFKMQGGYDQSAIRAGRNGMTIQDLQRAQRIVRSARYQKGNKFKKTRTLSELINYAKEQNPRFIQRLSEPPRGIQFVDDQGNQTRGNVYLEWSTDSNGNAIIYPRIQEMDDKKLKFLSTDDAYKRAMEKNNYLMMSPEEANIFFAPDDEYQTAYKRGWPEMFKQNWDDDSIIENLTPSHKQGGVLSEISFKDIPTEFLEEFIISEISLDNVLPEFKEGGKFNVIPEGALHARKHNMELEGITPKGIPVVSQAESGEIEQQAEIEREEIIFRLEVTKKLEELAKDGSDEAAIEAGKLLVDEILYNTIDNTNNLI